MAPLHQAHDLELGRVARAFTNLEFNVASCCWALLSPDRFVGPIVTDKLTSQRLFELVAQLGRVRLSRAGSLELEILMKRARGIAEKRNQLLHATWGVDLSNAAGGLVRFASFAPGKVMMPEQHRPEDIGAVAQEIQRLSADVSKFMEEWTLRPWNDTGFIFDGRKP